MSVKWKPIDFQGIVTLDKTIVQQLRRYLDEKESQLGNIITHAIHIFPTESLPVVIPFSSGGALALSDAVSAFGKNIEEISKREKLMVPADDWQAAIAEIHEALWDYVEVLEGSATELFQQIYQIGIDRWSSGLLGVVRAVKILLLERMDQITLVIDQLETLLWKYRWACEGHKSKWGWMRKFFSGRKRLLNGSLTSYLHRSKRSLKIHFSKFLDRYHRLQELGQRIEKSIKKFDHYEVFQDLEEDLKKNLLRLYRKLKLWKFNKESQKIPQNDTVQPLRESFTIEQTTQIFNEYYNAIREALFERSRLLKQETSEFTREVINKPLAIDMTEQVIKELQTLRALITVYREFFLKTHPDPYIRNRFGFVEWVVGPEPKLAKKLLYLVFDTERLEELFRILESSLKSGVEPQSTSVLERNVRAIENVLHEMGQPLMTRRAMRARGETVIEYIEEMNELGSFHKEVVGYVGRIFAKALRTDWRFHVLFEFPKFHQLYMIHQGIVGPYNNRHHMNRLLKFRNLIEQIEDWVKSRKVHRHTKEIEMDMNDMKESLQEFLRYVQKMIELVEAEKETVENVMQDISLQLLEYRYLFGNFFHHLHQYEPDGKIIRNQFLFVDQYFETIEDRLQNLRSYI